MSTIEKLKIKFYSKPTPNDITFDEVKRLAESYGCIVDNGGKHSQRVVYVPFGIVIPIPVHGKNVQEAYIKQLKELFDKIMEGGKSK